MYFLSSFFPLYNKCEEDAIKVKDTTVRLKILTYILNFININMNKEVNVNSLKILIVAHARI